MFFCDFLCVCVFLRLILPRQWTAFDNVWMKFLSRRAAKLDSHSLAVNLKEILGPPNPTSQWIAMHSTARTNSFAILFHPKNERHPLFTTIWAFNFVLFLMVFFSPSVSSVYFVSVCFVPYFRVWMCAIGCCVRIMWMLQCKTYSTCSIGNVGVCWFSCVWVCKSSNIERPINCLGQFRAQFVQYTPTNAAIRLQTLIEIEIIH